MRYKISAYIEIGSSDKLGARLAPPRSVLELISNSWLEIPALKSLNTGKYNVC